MSPRREPREDVMKYVKMLKLASQERVGQVQSQVTLVCGRGAGKTTWMGFLIAMYAAVMRDLAEHADL